MSRFRFSTEVRVRLPETDAFGIVFHGYYFTYFDVARMDYLRKIGFGDAPRPTGAASAIVHASADFKSPARYGDVLVVSTRIGKIGKTSFSFDFEVRHKAEDRVVAVGRTVHAAIDEKTWRPVPVSDAFRKAVESYES